jgi:hypothetical protein
MADVNLAELEAEYSRALKAYITAMVAQGIQNQTHEPTDQEQPDPRNQGVKTGGGRNGGPFNPRD